MNAFESVNLIVDNNPCNNWSSDNKCSEDNYSFCWRESLMVKSWTWFQGELRLMTNKYRKFVGCNTPSDQKVGLLYLRAIINKVLEIHNFRLNRKDFPYDGEKTLFIIDPL